MSDPHEMVFVRSLDMETRAPTVRRMERQYVGGCITSEREISIEEAGHLYNTGDWEFTPRAVEGLFLDMKRPEADL